MSVQLFTAEAVGGGSKLLHLIGLFSGLAARKSLRLCPSGCICRDKNPV